MTFYGLMKTINISTLKSRASSILREVRRGMTYIVVFRDIPVAEIKHCGEYELVIQPPEK